MLGTGRPSMSHLVQRLATGYMRQNRFYPRTLRLAGDNTLVA